MLSISMKQVLAALAALALVVVVVGAVPPRASAEFDSSRGAGHGFGRTAGITDGTSNTVVTPGSVLLSRKAGGGQQEYILLPPPRPTTSTR